MRWQPTEVLVQHYLSSCCLTVDVFNTHIRWIVLLNLVDDTGMKTGLVSPLVFSDFIYVNKKDDWISRHSHFSHFYNRFLGGLQISKVVTNKTGFQRIFQCINLNVKHWDLIVEWNCQVLLKIGSLLHPTYWIRSAFSRVLYFSYSFTSRQTYNKWDQYYLLSGWQGWTVSAQQTIILWLSNQAL